MSGKPKRLMVMAGGTGGHVFPGLAVAHHLMAQGWQVRWLGTADRMEADLVPKHGIEIDFIRISGLRGKGLKAQLTAPLRIWQAVRQAKAIMRSYQPDVVLGMGGYVSGPGGLAAWQCGIPVVLHEQNGIAGLTNRWLARIAAKVMQAFPGAFPNAEVVGNPVRTDVLALPLPAERLQGREGPIRVLVIGGSQGARVLNQTVPEVAARLGDRITLWHQVGKGALETVLRDYERVGQTQHKVTEFIDDMAAAYAWADVVVCRSGALTVSEIAAAGLPAIFVPFMHKDRQQYWNARPLEEAGAAKIIEQPQFNADVVAELLASWDRKTLLAMAEKARAVAIPDATERVAAELVRLAK
ncbi:undecaprenyldiphospho-muramoylpentapeptide beta-N-acetylglucosaminyltransferase [Serratia sp. OLHL2]|jgi:UDP-N-acetylglucosamine--N-acetylmuramyl-(pentapeptide) pyrophosphoryl-undecaprenol N-acetylglucosamine transferase|uniref:UDP-N-acetylglucosamine--N-acetylmuramyl-(pentapeptide) pyrophosphoryl-undecaprenol N-acetylglucosamine transferase n=16 Tax=Gammaproteobacteria TaxID=1236 RepID=A0A9X9C335_9GAMM|nr:MULTISPECIES: undecaprenyldiphospho-muramoylpentapeptide beta-N-acetylglucosaminyltransferase [Serratia]KAB5493198.1 undecaprenyldiphospho-muramoylpentapeptide beta-N-acetylglucosaminyltransferase [Enterobacter sp. RJAL6]KLE40132.1 UDP-diphospho-muramoylpentapeptide beta-N- acetylglucosaminyltransferase [Serratia sp. TEL]MCY4788220.1 undecaprenyldiphospho-muramoylpentapeptide beta-N-acetylglucosaminyltransferase [Acinetobacter baumannii]MDI6932992.1 undecaprenyldiphospho-muramoylpentapeptide